MTTQDQKTKTPWDQSGFKKLKSGWSKERIAEDKKCLKEIFKLAADSPTLKQALAWARGHGIKFFVDRQAVNCGGYYTPGTGVFAIAKKYADPGSFAAEVVTHEIRHAWQDYHGLCPTDYPNPVSTPDFTGYFIKLALVEADALAFGRRARDEYSLTKDKQLLAEVKKYNMPNGDWLLSRVRTVLPTESFALGEGFLSWFSSPRTTQFYGDSASKHFGQAAGIYNGALPARNFEFTTQIQPQGAGVDITSLEDILRLGESFSGQNYLSKLSRDVLPKKILSPSLAMSFYNAANDDQKKLVTELRKCYLRNKLSAATPSQKP